MKLKKILSILISAVLVLSSIVPVFAYTGEATEVSNISIAVWNGVNKSTGEDGSSTFYAQATAGGDNSYARAAISASKKFVPGSAIGVTSFDVTPINPINSTSYIYVYVRGNVYEPKVDVQMPKAYFDRLKLKSGTNKISVVYTKPEAEGEFVKINYYVNGLKEGEATATQEMIDCGDIIFFDQAVPSVEGEYGYKISNPAVKVYPADATLAEVKAELGLLDATSKVNRITTLTDWVVKTAAQNAQGDWTVTTDGGNADGGKYMRTIISTKLADTTKYAYCSFELNPSMDGNSGIQFYKVANRPTVSLNGKLNIGEKNKIDVVFTPFNQATSTQSFGVFVNGNFIGSQTLTAAAGTDAFDTVLIYSTVPHSGEGYTYTYSNIASVEFPEGTALGQVLDYVSNEVAVGGVLWSGVPTIEAKTYTSVIKDGNVYKVAKTANNQTSVNVSIKRDYNDADVFGKAKYMVTKINVKNLYNTPLAMTMLTPNGVSSKISVSQGTGTENYYTIITDLKENKEYVFLDNVEQSTVVSYTGVHKETLLYFTFNAADKTYTGDLSVVEPISTVIYSEDSDITLADIKANVIDGYFRKTSIGKLKNGVTANADGSFTFVNPENDLINIPEGVTKSGYQARFNVQVSPLIENSSHPAIDVNFVHFHFEVSDVALTEGTIKFAGSHNIDQYTGATSASYTLDPAKKYNVDVVYDRLATKHYVYVDGVKVAENSTNARVSCASYINFIEQGTKLNAGANSAKISNCYIDYYFNNNQEIKTFDALLAEIFPEGTKEAGYNFVTDATLTEDGRYTFKKEVFGYNSNFQSGLVAAYDSSDALIATKIFNAYNGDEVMTLTKAPAYFKLFLWGKDNKNPLIEAKTVNIAQ